MTAPGKQGWHRATGGRSAVAALGLVVVLLAFGNAPLAAGPLRPLAPAPCATDLDRVRSQFPLTEPGHYYLIVRHHGDPETAEWFGQVANPVTYDVGEFTGFRPPAPVSAWQRGFHDRGWPDGSSAVQLHCRDVGFMLNTYQFQHTVPLTGGGPNIVYEHHFDPRPAIWARPDDRLHFSLDLRLPWLNDGQADHATGRGVAQVSLFYYVEHPATGHIFAHVIALFDSRPFGLGNGHEFIGHDTFFDFASSPLRALTVDGVAPRYIQRIAGSSEMRNDAPWADTLHFAVEIGQPEVQRILDDVAEAGSTPASAADYRLRSVGVLVEAFPGSNNDYNVSIGGSFSGLDVSTRNVAEIFADGFGR